MYNKLGRPRRQTRLRSTDSPAVLLSPSPPDDQMTAAYHTPRDTKISVGEFLSPASLFTQNVQHAFEIMRVYPFRHFHPISFRRFDPQNFQRPFPRPLQSEKPFFPSALFLPQPSSPSIKTLIAQPLPPAVLPNRFSVRLLLSNDLSPLRPVPSGTLPFSHDAPPCFEFAS